MALPCYATVEDVKRALDQKETARNDAQIFRAVQSASRTIDDACNRFFYPLTTTRFFEWPSVQYKTPWKIWLDENELTALTSITAGGVAIPPGSIFLEPSSLGPPFAWIEIDRSTTYGFNSGATPQRAIAITGTFGYSDDTEAVTTLASAISSTNATTLTVANGASIGVGDTLKADSERMLVTARAMTTTSNTVSLTNSAADVTVAVSNGAAFALGEVLLLDSERLLVVDITGNNLTVKRAWDGTVLASHSSSTLYASRLLTVQRALTGTTVATHSNAATVYRQTVPAPVRDLAIALGMNRFLQETGGYARNIVGGTRGGDNSRLASGGALPALMEDVTTRYGRTRWGAV